MAADTRDFRGRLNVQLAHQIRKVEEYAASHHNASVDAVMRQLRARRQMVRTVILADAGDLPAVQALCDFAKDRRQLRSERAFAVMLLGQLSTTIEAQNCLEALATSTTEPAGLRWMAMMVLSQTDSAGAYRTLYRVLDNPRSDSTMVRDDKGTELPLSYWAIEFLDETSTGRDFLKTAPRRPRDNPRVWSLVVVWWMSAGDSSYWPIVEEVIRDQSYPFRSRHSGRDRSSDLGGSPIRFQWPCRTRTHASRSDGGRVASAASISAVSPARCVPASSCSTSQRSWGPPAKSFNRIRSRRLAMGTRTPSISIV